MFKLSRYFADLSSSYNAELDDLRTDSEGNNVLKARLAKKREQVPQLLMMMECAPEMVAVAFHGAFFFKNAMELESLVTRDASQFPTWTNLKKAIVIEPWAEALIKTVLTNPNGETFLITTVGLEYLNRASQTRAAQSVDTDQDELNDEHEVEHDDLENEAYLNSDERFSDEGETTKYDLDKAGANWLAEQGFDRKE